MVEIEEIFSSERGKGSRSAAVGRFERATLEVDTNRRSGRATYMMTFRGSLGLVAIFGLFSMAAASPWFYHGLEGPSFTEKNTTSSGLEIRSYPESYWTATTVTGKNMDSAGSEAFMRLFRYISGDNERNEKIEMTVPVLASVVPGQVRENSKPSVSLSLSLSLCPSELFHLTDTPPLLSAEGTFLRGELHVPLLPAQEVPGKSPPPPRSHSRF